MMDAQETFRQINILYYALLAGQILFCAVLVFALLDPETRQSGWPDLPFNFVVPAILAGSSLIALTINKNQLSKGAAQSDLLAKVSHYRNLVIIRAALIEGANLFCLVVLLLENNLVFLVLFGAGFLVFLNFRPSVAEFQAHYHLSSADKAAFKG